MNFYITIKKRIAEVLSDGGRLPLLVCDNSDNRIVFTFDEEWDAYSEKIARFVYRENGGHGEIVSCDVSFSGNQVTVPRLRNVSELWVGVIGNGTVTTSAARIACITSISGFSGVEGASDAVFEDVTVELWLKDGNQTVTADAGKTLSSVTILRPDTLIPENIRAGIVIAGVEGAYSGESVGAPTISLDGEVLTVFTGDADTTSYSLLINGTGVMSYPADTVSIDLSVVLNTYNEGSYAVTLVAYKGGLVSLPSNAVTYVKTAEDIPMPTVRMNNNLLIVDIEGGDPETVKLYVNGEYRTEDLYDECNGWFFMDQILASDPSGTYTMKVNVVYSDGTESGFTNEVTYVHTCEGEEEENPTELDAPTILLSGATLTIAAVEGATEYTVWHDNNGEDDDELIAEVPAFTGTKEIDLTEFLDEGENGIWVVATYSSGTAESEKLVFSCVSGEIVYLEVPTISISNRYLCVTLNDSRAEGYRVMINGKLEVEYPNDTPLSLKHCLKKYDNGYYEITVHSFGQGFISPESETLTYYHDTVMLNAPVISLDGDVLTLTESDQRAEWNSVYVNGKLAKSYSPDVATVNIGMLLQEYDAGEYTITVVTTGENCYSATSNAVTYTKEEGSASAPTVHMNNNVLVVEEVVGSTVDTIKVYVNGSYRTEGKCEDNNGWFFMDQILANDPSGTYTLKVKAVYTDGSESDFSNEVSYTHVAETSGTNTLTLNAQGTCYRDGASYEHEICVSGAGTSKTYTVETTIVGDEYDAERGEYLSYTYPVVHVADLAGLSESDTVTIVCENLRNDRTPVEVIASGCNAVSAFEERFYTDDDGEERTEEVNVVTITNITAGATVTLVFDADA